jgi:hypothetical protein
MQRKVYIDIAEDCLAILLYRNRFRYRITIGEPKGGCGSRTPKDTGYCYETPVRTSLIRLRSPKGGLVLISLSSAHKDGPVGFASLKEPLSRTCYLVLSYEPTIGGMIYSRSKKTLETVPMARRRVARNGMKQKGCISMRGTLRSTRNYTRWNDLTAGIDSLI